MQLSKPASLQELLTGVRVKSYLKEEMTQEYMDQQRYTPTQVAAHKAKSWSALHSLRWLSWSESLSAVLYKCLRKEVWCIWSVSGAS